MLYLRQLVCGRGVVVRKGKILVRLLLWPVFGDEVE
jgi:hypothetical protein